VAPTLLALLGVPQPAAMTGHSLLERPGLACPRLARLTRPCHIPPGIAETDRSWPCAWRSRWTRSSPSTSRATAPSP
jgi:hypothetical protein